MEAGGMARQSKQESVQVMWKRYQRADRATRSALLDEVTRVSGYHRKYAIGLLSQTQTGGVRTGGVTSCSVHHASASSLEVTGQIHTTRPHVIRQFDITRGSFFESVRFAPCH